jgi:radical SAM family uncharacterized protein
VSWQLKEKLQKVLSAEQGTKIFAPGSREGFALVYPNTYHVGMSNLGFQIIYQQINSRGDTACERLFLPDRKSEQEYVRTNTPLLTVETQRPLYEFPLIGFAVSFEMDYFNILNILALGKVTLRADDRAENDPIVIAGGPCATFNPEPIADFFDVFIIGEGEEVIHELLDVYYRGREQGLSREAILLMLAGLEGVYVPRFYQPVYSADGTVAVYRQLAEVPAKIQRRWVKNLDDFPGHMVVVTDDTEFKDMFLMEISRGCGRHCRFCMAGYCFRRPRARSFEHLTETVRLAKTYRNKVGLVGAAVSDYPDIDKLSRFIIDEGMTFSVASLRADSLTPALAQALAASGHRTITLAPEAASVKMRQVINKGITDKHLADAVAMAIEAGIPHVRLYIMVGLPFETDDDIDAIALMARTVKREMERLGSNGKLTLSINPFVPKPFTPFQWVSMAEFPVVSDHLKTIQTALRGEKGIEVLTESPKEAYIQATLSRGDRRLAAVLLEAHRRGGVKGWKKAMKQLEVDEAFYLYRERSLQEVFPWQHLDMGLHSSYLAQELERSRQEKPTAACLPGCTRCGVCK